MAESFFHTRKTELLYREDIATHEQAHTVVFEDIEVFYNRQRCHSANGYLAPLTYEQALKANGYARNSVDTSPAPPADRFIGHANATSEQELIHVAVAETKAAVQPDTMADDFRWKSVSLVCGG